MIITENIDTKRHKKAYKNWGSLLFIGDPLVVFLSYSFLNNFNLSWQKTFIIIVLIFTITTLLIHFILPEVDMNQNSSSNSESLHEPQNEGVSNF